MLVLAKEVRHLRSEPTDWYVAEIREVGNQAPPVDSARVIDSWSVYRLSRSAKWLLAHRNVDVVSPMDANDQRAGMLDKDCLLARL